MLMSWLIWILSLHPALIASLAIGALIVWFGLGYLALRIWLIAIDNLMPITVRYSFLVLGPILLAMSISAVIVAILHILIVKCFWQNIVCAACKNLHRHLKSL